jgi:hypothetical protein
MLDPYADAVNSPIGIVRIPARRERELLALRVIGLLAWPCGTVQPGTHEEQQEARTWLRPQVA